MYFIKLFKWIFDVATSAVEWMVAHPVVAIVVGVTLIILSEYLRQQSWSGAAIVADLVGTTGRVVLAVGLGAWIAQQIRGEVGQVIDYVVDQAWGAGTWVYGHGADIIVWLPWLIP